METIIFNDPTQWKLFVIFLSMLWFGLLLWRQWRRILRVEGQLHKLQTAKVNPEQAAAGGPTTSKLTR